jgi:hypothetical protein
VAVFESKAPELKPRAEDDSIDGASAAALMRDFDAELLISAAGTYNRIEHTFRLAARDIGVPVVAVCDYWYDYAASFGRTVDGTETESRPDFVCVPDETARLGLIDELGMSSDRVIVTGPPHLEASVIAFQSVTDAERTAWRQRYGLREDEVTVVFFSDAFYTGPNGTYETAEGRLFDGLGRSIFGYTPPEILAAVMNSLRRVADEFGRKVHVIVKPHPREHSEKLIPILDEPGGPWLRSELITGASPTELISVADVVVGMGSVVLLESALAGRPTISVQVGLKDVDIYDPCIGNTLGYTVPVFDTPTLDRVVRWILEGSVADSLPSPPDPLRIVGATARAADVVEPAMLWARVA